MSPEREGEVPEGDEHADATERRGEPAEPDRDPAEIGGGLTEEFETEFGDDFGTELEAPDEPEPEPERPESSAGEDTVEADALALADAEEAREREKAHEEQGEEAPQEDAEEAEEEGVEEVAEEEPEEVAAEAEPADGTPAPVAAPPPPPTAVAARQRTGQLQAAAPPAPAVPVEEDAAPRTGLWLRFLAASFVIVVSMAAATSVTLLLYLSDLAEGLGGIKGVQSKLATVEGGDPQTILILGSDERAQDPSARSDTTMLLRVDPNQDAIALFSLPRDLKVNIPGHGIDKLNAAYTIGGPKLTLKTVKQLTGLEINHLVNVNFKGFFRAVNAIDCVYVDVDRHYFNSNAGLPPELQFAEIDVKAGYQRLCGREALEYVRYRHTDNDVVRGARQQDFLREARQKVSPGRLWRDRRKLMDIFTRYTTSDIDDELELLDLLETFLAARSGTVSEIHFEGRLGKSYVTSSVEQMQDAVLQFLNAGDTPGPAGGKKGRKAGGGKEERRDRGGDSDGAARKVSGAELIDTEFGERFGRRFGRKVDFPIAYPTRLAPGSTFGNGSRTYHITGPEEKDEFPAYKIVISRPGTFGFDEYYGVMGTSWGDPPILDNPSETREIGGRDYRLFYDGDRLRLVGWKTRRASYWINNTLLQTLEENEMLGIARSTRTYSARETSVGRLP